MAEPAQPRADAQPRPGDPPWLDALWALVGDLPGLLSDRVELLSLELTRAGRALAKIVALLVAIAILGVTAWLALWGSAVGALMVVGLHWAAALLLVVLLNLAACAWALARLRGLAKLLQLPATRRHLTLRTPESRAVPGSPAGVTTP